ncbi:MULTISPECIES: hypothetical protein [Bradyrhizobium]|uniref:Uncharacterized protein n=1 Tax=Bradyrhizobium brasilense TaxID=1419277 RepID=A0ABY8JJQ5_9BRAD|nr:hypothetical protein [Bradyrhizobium brasilense]WFU65348.1 hypothetical protein QA636_07370 [Bradyrhizobium brasilense]
MMEMRQLALDDRYTATSDEVLLNGAQGLLVAMTNQIGSGFALEYRTREEVDRFLVAEPYCVSVHPMTVMVPERHPGFQEDELRRQLSEIDTSKLVP